MLKIFAPNTTDFTTNGVGVLNEATNIKVAENIDGSRVLEFQLDFNSNNWKLIREGMLVLCKTQLYYIMRYSRKNRGTEPCLVYCTHVFSDAGSYRKALIEEDELSCYDWVKLAFLNTKFKVLSPEEVGRLGLRWVDKYVYFEEQADICAGELLSRLIDSMQYGELYIDNWKIAIVERIGRNRGMRITEGYNAEYIEEDTDITEMINIIQVIGADGLPLPARYPNSTIRSEDSIRKYGERRGTLTFDTVDDELELERKALYSIAPSNELRVDMPKSAVTVGYVDLSKIGEYAMLELGDTVNIDSLLTNAEYTNTRVTSIEYYPYEPINSSITVGNPPRTITDMIQGSVITGNVVDKVINGYDEIKSSHLSNIQKSLQTWVNAELQRLQVEVHKTGDVWIHPDNPNLALGVIGGCLMIANGRTPEGDFAWKTFGTGDGFVADLITTGVLNTSLVQILSDSGLTRLYADKLEMYANLEDDKPIFHAGVQDDGRFEFAINNADGTPAIYMDSQGYIKVNGQIDADVSVSDSMYSDMGYVSDMTVNSINTADYIARYLNRDTSSINYQRQYENKLEFVNAQNTGGSQQLKDYKGRLLYWMRDILGADIIDGAPYIDGRRVGVTHNKTDYPVIVFEYKEYVKRQLSFDNMGVPYDIHGVGTESNDSLRGKVVIQKDNTNFKMVKYHDNKDEISSGIVLNDTGITIIGGSFEPQFVKIYNDTFEITDANGNRIIKKAIFDEEGNIKAIQSDNGKVMGISIIRENRLSKTDEVNL